MSLNSRKINYGLAINEALIQIMETDSFVFLIGQGVKSPWYVGNTCNDLVKKFGEERVIDTPVSENAITGVAVGAGIVGMKSVVVHPRIDFALFAFDPIINQAANWHYMSGGRSNTSVVFWLIINRRGEQAAQHSQALHSLFTHIPGLKVVAPSTAHDAKGLLISAINDPNPVVFIDNRLLYEQTDDVPTEMYEIPIGKGIVRRNGTDITIVSSSYMMIETIKSADKLAQNNISAEIIDLRTLKPYDKDLILSSVKKTGRLVIVDGSWKTTSITAEISAFVAETIFEYIKAPIKRVNLPDCPAPAAETMENAYYIKDTDITNAAMELMKDNKSLLSDKI